MEEHVVLYRQFRPLTFDDVIGQKASVGALRQAVISGRFAVITSPCTRVKF